MSNCKYCGAKSTKNIITFEEIINFCDKSECQDKAGMADYEARLE